jgi:hypothetical protein
MLVKKRIKIEVPGVFSYLKLVESPEPLRNLKYSWPTQFGIKEHIVNPRIEPRACRLPELSWNGSECHNDKYKNDMSCSDTLQF